MFFLKEKGVQNQKGSVIETAYRTKSGSHWSRGEKSNSSSPTQQLMASPWKGTTSSIQN